MAEFQFRCLCKNSHQKSDLWLHFSITNIWVLVCSNDHSMKAALRAKKQVEMREKSCGCVSMPVIAACGNITSLCQIFSGRSSGEPVRNSDPFHLDKLITQNFIFQPQQISDNGVGRTMNSTSQPFRNDQIQCIPND